MYKYGDYSGPQKRKHPVLYDETFKTLIMAQTADEIVAVGDRFEMATGGRSSPISLKSHGTNKGDATTEDSTAQVVAVGRGGADAGLEAMGYTPQLKRVLPISYIPRARCG